MAYNTEPLQGSPEQKALQNPGSVVDQSNTNSNTSTGEQEVPQSYKIGEKEYQAEELQKYIENASKYDSLQKEFTRKSQRLSEYEKSLLGLEPNRVANLAQFDALLQSDEKYAKKFAKFVASLSEDEQPPQPVQQPQLDPNDPMFEFDKRLQERLTPLQQKMAQYEQLIARQEASSTEAKAQQSLDSEFKALSQNPELAEVPQSFVLSMIAADGTLSVEDAARKVKMEMDKIVTGKLTKETEAAKARAEQEKKKIEKSGGGAKAVVSKELKIGTPEHKAAQIQLIQRLNAVAKA